MRWPFSLYQSIWRSALATAKLKSFSSVADILAGDQSWSLAGNSRSILIRSRIGAYARDALSVPCPPSTALLLASCLLIAIVTSLMSSFPLWGRGELALGQSASIEKEVCEVCHTLGGFGVRGAVLTDAGQCVRSPPLRTSTRPPRPGAHGGLTSEGASAPPAAPSARPRGPPATRSHPAPASARGPGRAWRGRRSTL